MISGKRLGAALVGSIALVGALTACSDDEKDSAASDTAASSTAASSSAASSAESSNNVSSVTVDGAAWPGEYASKCVKTGDTTALSIYSTSGDASRGGGATLNGDTVVSVGLGEAASGLGYQNGTPGLSATLVQDGNTFTVTGEAFGGSAADPTQPTKSTFEIVFACDTITVS